MYVYVSMCECVFISGIHARQEVHKSLAGPTLLGVFSVCTWARVEWSGGASEAALPSLLCHA